jgi:hypothetical protein
MEELARVVFGVEAARYALGFAFAVGPFLGPEL